MSVRIYLHVVALGLVAGCAYAAPLNLFPNGNAENVCVNLLIKDEGNASHIEANETGVPSYWRLNDEAARCEDVTHDGAGAIRLSGGESDATATVFTDYWRVKDPSMPFGLPIFPERAVRLTFWYKTDPGAPADTLSATLKLGVIPELDPDSQTIALAPSDQWREVVISITPTALRWGAELTFRLDKSAANHAAWVDSVHLSQGWEDWVNLVRNPSFEDVSPGGTWPPRWDAPIEDEWVSWVGGSYRPPVWERTGGAGGSYAMRASVTHGEVSGVSQRIVLNQDQPRLLAFRIRTKLDNSVGNQPPGYYGCDNQPNLTLYVYHTDGAMQEVSPTFSLGESDHGWDERRGGFMPLKPVRAVRLQVTLIGTEPTTTLWIDDVALYEIAEHDGAAAPDRDAPPRTVVSSWGNAQDTPIDHVLAANDAHVLHLGVPRSSEGGTVSIYLNPDASAPFMNYRRYWYDVLHITARGELLAGKVAEKQGYKAVGLLVPATDAGFAIHESTAGYWIDVPFTALGLDGPPANPLGLNVVWETPSGDVYWTGNAINREGLGRLVTAPKPLFEIQSLTFGERWELEPDQSQDFVSHPQIYAGLNRATLVFRAPPGVRSVKVRAGVAAQSLHEAEVTVAPGEDTTVSIPYDAGAGPKMATFGLWLDAGDGQEIAMAYPLEVPPGVEFVLDQEFYYPEEQHAVLDVRNRFRPIDPDGVFRVSLVDERTETTVYTTSHSSGDPVFSCTVPIDSLRLNPLPVQDYTARIEYLRADGTLIASRTRPLGRINHTQRRSLPPIDSLEVGDQGRLIINGDLRFFPIVPSLSNHDYEAAVDMGANVRRAYYSPGKKSPHEEDGIFDIVEDFWARNTYTMTIGPGSGAPIKENTSELYDLLSHPAFLGCYAQQFYYWRLSSAQLAYRDGLETLFGDAPTQKLLIWGHHDSSLLYDRERDTRRESGAPIGYCYTKIMGRPGPAWRNAPFLTLTEQALDPDQFKLGEVNFYVSWFDDEIVPEHFKTYRSIRGDDWRGLRNESYLAVIYGADGLYHYICTQKGGLQRLRGWFQELNHIWPCFVADDAPNPVTVRPASSPVEARLKVWEGKHYLITANGSEEPAEADITIDGLDVTSARKLFNLPGDLQTHGAQIRDVWGRYDAFVYEID